MPFLSIVFLSFFLCELFILGLEWYLSSSTKWGRSEPVILHTGVVNFNPICVIAIVLRHISDNIKSGCRGRVGGLAVVVPFVYDVKTLDPASLRPSL